MEQLLESARSATTGGSGVSAWKNPTRWLLEKKLSRRFWVFFTVAFFFDVGFSVYYFLFNLYLLDFHFNERVIGLVGGALTLGTVVGTLPVGWLARKIGLRPPLICSMIVAPLLGAMRAIVMREWAQIGLAFLAGLAMCIWGVCFPPMVARLTTTENRASAFSLIFSASIGASALGGLISFVGLIIPHILRMILGPDHVRLLPATALAGALFLLVADTAARTIIAPSEVPVGVLTAFIGGPFFLYLLRKARREVTL